MKKMINSWTCVLLLVFGICLLLPADPACSAEKQHKQVTRELIALVEANLDIKSMLTASITEARKNNPDSKTNPVQTMEQYYDFIDKSSELLPQEILTGPSESVRDQMLQGICYFYFLVDQPLAALEGKGLYRNTLQYYPPFSSWLRSFADAWGMFLDTNASWNNEIYQQIYADPMFGLQKGWFEPAANWKTFNEFFARYLANPGVRPIAAPKDPAVVVAPADSVPQGVWAIDDHSRIQVDGGLRVKLATYYNIEDLLGEESRYKDAFAGGVLTHTFLNVNDYHRYHFAVGGTVKETKVILKNVALEVSWDKKQEKYVPIDSTGWQFSQTRGYAIVDTGKYGLVALIPMGMAQVSSVNFEKAVQPDTDHQKGEMLGNFLFGGSDFIMLFQKRAGFEITAPTEAATGNEMDSGQTSYKHIYMGEAYGVMKGQGK